MAHRMQAEDGDDIIMVPVPKRHLASVYRALAAEMGQPVGIGDAAPPIKPEPPSSDTEWTREEIHRLKRMIRTITPRIVMDLTTDNPNERISLRDVETAAGRTYPQARADLAGFTQLIRRQFDHEAWPIKVEYGSGGVASYYCDSANIATWWQED